MRPRIISIFYLSAFLCLATAIPDQVRGQETSSVYELSLDELASLRVESGASLTRTEVRKTPAPVTRITRDMIEMSGARSLDEVLEIFVPNFYGMRSATKGPNLGIRGIIGARDNKVLLLINDRIMNNRLLTGATSERSLSMLGDIAYIDVVRSPGSAIFGPGAIAGVISIRTLSALTQQGLEIDITRGFKESFTRGEIRLGRSLGRRSGIFLYVGADLYKGAKISDSPVVFSRTSLPYFEAGSPIDTTLVAMNGSHDAQPRRKFHLQLDLPNTTLWARLTRAGMEFIPADVSIENIKDLQKSQRHFEYQQWTIFLNQRADITSNLSASIRVSYDSHEFARLDDWVKFGELEYSIAHREDELNTRSLFYLDLNDRHRLAAGFEYSREVFEKPLTITSDSSHQATRIYEPWTTHMGSIFGEYQGELANDITVFAGGRIDRHTYTNAMFSPKLAIIFTPGKRHTTKLLYNRSVRKSDDLELWRLHDIDPDATGETEQISALELIHRIDHNNYKVSASLFHSRAELIAWVARPTARVFPIGRETIGGLEVEFSRVGVHNRIDLRYAYTKLMGFDLFEEEILNQQESSRPYGYGSDLQNWPHHVAGLNYRQTYRSRFSFFTSLRLQWGFKGAEDYARYNTEVLQSRSLSIIEDEGTEAFDANVFLNTAVTISLDQRLRLDLSAYNILGWLKPSLNKRNFYARPAGYRIESPALSITLRFKP